MEEILPIVAVLSVVIGVTVVWPTAEITKGVVDEAWQETHCTSLCGDDGEVTDSGVCVCNDRWVYWPGNMYQCAESAGR